MRIPRIYHSTELKVDTLVQLEEQAAAHVGRVLRMQVGDKVTLFNGQGGQYEAVIEAANKKNVSVKVLSFDEHCSESPLSIHLGQGISRGDKMDYTIQKAVELGVTEITPLFTERCGVKLSGERLAKKHQQWQKIAISACEQCGRNTIPTIHPPQNLSDWLGQQNNQLKITLFPGASATIKTLPACPNGIRLIIGPEGGLSDEEIEQTFAADFTGINLGPRILRTETAGLCVVSALQLQFGDLA